MTAYSATPGSPVSGKTLNSGDTLTVFSGGTATTNTALPGGLVTVDLGGTAIATVVSGGTTPTGSGNFLPVGMIVSSGGTTLGATVVGFVDLRVQGYDSGTTISSGGYEIVMGGTAVGDIDSGTLIVSSGGTASAAIVEFGGSLVVSSGGTATSNTVLSGGLVTVDSGGTAIATVVSGGPFVSGGFLVQAMTVSSGGTTLGAKISGYVGLNVKGYGSGTTISSGGVEFVSGTTVGDIDSGLLLVDSGGTASATVVASGGSLTVSAGGYVSGVQVGSGGTMTVNSGGTNGYGVVNSGGSVTVQSGGTDQYSNIVATAQESVAGTVVGNTVSGTLIVSSGGTINGGTDAGTVVLSAAGTLSGLVSLANSGVFEFGSGTSGTLSGGTIFGWDGINGNKIEFAGYGGGSATAGSGTVTVSENGSSLTVNVYGVTAGETLTLDPNGFLGVCFLEGTHILAAGGERKVETLRAGDMVATLRNGQQVLQPIHWVGNRSVKITDSKMEDAYPVRIRAGAFADAVPHRDLLITQEHCVFVDGKLIPARMLVNGRSIIVDRTIGSYTYYHVELEQHGILLSEGLTTESYLDTGNRGNFANHEAIAIRPDFSVNTGHKSWETDAAAPLTVDRAAVEPVWRMLDERARERGVASTLAPLVLTEDPDLRLATDTGMKIRPMRVANGRYSFFVPANTSRLRLLSRTARPSETVGPFLDDRRALGVLVGEVAAWHGAERVVSNLHLTTPELEGWFTQEDGPRRWTNGNAVLPVSLGTKAVMLEIEVVWAGPYLQEAQAGSLADRKSA